MRFRRLFLIGIFVAVVPTLLFGTGSFTSVSAERGLDVSVVDDQNAYLGVTEETLEEGENGGQFTALHLEDQFPGDTDLELEHVETDGDFVTVTTSAGAEIGGPSDPLDVDVRCADDSVGTETVEFSITAEGTGVKADVDHSVGITCHLPADPDSIEVTFNGCGSVTVTGDAGLFRPGLDATLKLKRPGEGRNSEETFTEDVTYEESGQTISKRGDGKIYAVEIEGETYLNDESTGNPNDCVSGEKGE